MDKGRASRGHSEAPKQQTEIETQKARITDLEYALRNAHEEILKLREVFVTSNDPTLQLIRRELGRLYTITTAPGRPRPILD